MLRDLPADERTVPHRVAPVQAGPNAGVIDLSHQRVQIFVCPLRLNRLGYRGIDIPRHLVAAEEFRYCIRKRRRIEAVAGRIFRVIDRQQRGQCLERYMFERMLRTQTPALLIAL